MSQIKKFIDKISNAEARNVREVMISLTDAKELRDEVMKLLLDKQATKNDQEPIEVVMKGGKW